MTRISTTSPRRTESQRQTGHACRWLVCASLLVIAPWLHADESAEFGRVASKELSRVYVPVSELDTIFERDRSGVLLPAEEFDRLYEAARQELSRYPDGPAPVAVTQAVYHCELADDQLLIDAVIELEQTGPGRCTLALPLDRLSLLNAELDGEPAPIGRDAKNGQRRVLFLNQPGRRQLKLKLVAPVAKAGSDAIVGFGLLPAPVGQLIVTAPAERHLQVDGLSPTRQQPIEDANEYVVAVGGRQQVTLTFTARVQDATGDALVMATSGYGLNVAPGEVTWRVSTTLQVVGRPLDELNFDVPATLEIADVAALGLESWTLADDPDAARTVITLRFAQPIEGSRKIDLRGVLPVAEGEPWAVPALRLRNVTSHIGRIIVQSPPSTRLRVLTAEGVRPALDATESPEESARSRKTVFDIWQEDFRLRLAGEVKQRSLHLAAAAVFQLQDHEASFQSRLSIRPLFAPLFTVDIRLPADWTVREFTAKDRESSWQPHQAIPGEQLLRLTFAEPIPAGGSAQLGLRMTRNMPFADDHEQAADQMDVEFLIPEVIVPEAEVAEGTFAFTAASDLRVRPGEMTGLYPIGTENPAERLRLSYRRQDYSGYLLLSRTKPRPSATTLVHVRLDPELIVSHLQTDVRIDGGRTRRLNVEFNRELADEPRFELFPETARIIEQTTTVDEQSGHTVVSLELDRRIEGRWRLLTSLREPRGEDEAAAVPLMTISGASRRTDYVAVEAGPEQRIVVTATDADGNAVPEIDPLELPAATYQPRERIVSVFRLNEAPETLTLSEERFDGNPLPVAVGSSLVMTTVADALGQLQTRATLQLKSVGLQHLRVRLPEQARLWAVTVQGRPVEIRQADGEFIVPLPLLPLEQTGEFPLEVFYSSPAETEGHARQITQGAPEFLAETNTGETGPITILKQTWDLHTDPHILVQPGEGAFSPQTLERPTGWITGWYQEYLRIPTLGKAMNAGIVALVCLVIIGVARILRERFNRGAAGLGRGFAISVGILIVLVAIPLFLPSVQQSREAARRSSLRNVDKQADLEQDHFGYPQGGDGPAPASGSAITTAPQPSARPAEVSSFEAINAPADPFAMTPQPPVTAPREAGDSGNAAGKADKSPMQRLDENSDFAPVAEPADRMQRARGLEFGGEIPEIESRLSLVIQDINREGVMDGEEMMGFSLDSNVGDVNGNQAVEFGTRRAAAGGLLSLPVQLEIPPHSRRHRFEYTGTRTATDGVNLEVRLARDFSGDVWRVSMLVLWLAILWFVARRSPTLAVLGLIVPFGLAGIVSSGRQPLLDGIALGSLCGLLAAGTCALLRSLYHLGARLRSHTIAAGLVVTAAMCSSGSVGLADEPAPPPHTVIIPFEEDEDPAAADKVYLTRDQFLKLWNATHPEAANPAQESGDGIVAEASYVARQSAEHPELLLVDARFVCVNFRKRSVELPLPLGRAAVRSAGINGKPIPLTFRDGHMVAVIEPQAPAVLDVTFEVSVRTTGAAGEAVLPLLPVASGRLSFELPIADADVRFPGLAAPFRRVQRDGKTFVDVPVDEATRPTISWQPPEMGGELGGVVHAEGLHRLHIDDRGLRLVSDFDVQVRQGELTRLEFRIPTAMKLGKITGPDVGGWEIRIDDESRTLSLLLRRAVKDRTSVKLEAVLPDVFSTEQKSFSISPPEPLGVTYEAGTIGADWAEHLDVRIQPVGQPRQRDVQSWKGADGVQAVYGFNRRPAALQVRVARRRSQIEVQAEHAVQIEDRTVDLSTRFVVTADGSLPATTTLRLPEFLELAEVTGTGLTDWYRDRDDEHRLILEFAPQATGSRIITIYGVFPKQPDDEVFDLELPFVPEVGKASGHLAVWTAEDIAASLGDIGEWISLRADELPAALRKVVQAEPRFAMRTRAVPPPAISFELRRERPRLLADSLSVMNVTDTHVGVSLLMRWRIRQASVDTLTFHAPAWLDGLQFPGNAIRQATVLPAGPGRVEWTLLLSDRVRDNFLATAVATIPLDAALVTAPAIRFTSPSADGEQAAVEVQRHYTILVNESQATLSLRNPDQIDAIEIDSLPLAIDEVLRRQAAEVWKSRDVDTPPSWDMQRREQAEVAAASVNLADLTTVLAIDGSWRTRAAYRIRNLRRQYLAVIVPPEGQLLSAMVESSPVRPVVTVVGETPVVLLPLPRKSAADRSFEVALVLEGELPRSLPGRLGWGGRQIDLPAPRILSQQDSPEFGIPVAQTRWTVHLPDRYTGVPLRQTDRTNLDEVSRAKIELAATGSMLKEAEELWQTLSQDSKKAVKYRAADNLRALNDSLRSTLSSNTATGAEGEIVLQQGRSLERMEAQLQRFYDDEDRRGSRLRGVDADVIIEVDGLGASVTEEDAVQFRVQQQVENLTIANDDIAVTTFNNTDEFFGNRFAVTPSAEPGKRELMKEKEPQSAQQADRRQLQELNTLQLGELLKEQKEQPQASQNLWMDLGVQSRSGRQPAANFTDGDAKSWGFEGLEAVQPVTPQTSRSSRVLSLPIALSVPGTGQTLTFLKAGGDARLGLNVRSETVVRDAGNWLWALFWLGIAAALAVTVGRSEGNSARPRRTVPVLLIIASVPLFILGHGAVLVVAAILLLVGGLWPTWWRTVPVAAE